jgi:hypothetical protein
MKTLAQLQSNDFAPYLNETFIVRLGGVDPIGLELVSVTEFGRQYRPDARQPFSIHFLGPVSSQYLLQSTYHLEHPQLGDFDLFLVPIGPERGHMRYEAILA